MGFLFCFVLLCVLFFQNWLTRDHKKTLILELYLTTLGTFWNTSITEGAGCSELLLPLCHFHEVTGINHNDKSQERHGPSFLCSQPVGSRKEAGRKGRGVHFQLYSGPYLPFFPMRMSPMNELGPVTFIPEQGCPKWLERRNSYFLN